MLGRPADQVNDAVLAWRLPLRLRQWLYHRILRLTVGDLTRFGLPRPDHKVYETHPIANSQLVYYVGHGAITPVPDVTRFRSYSVELSDGSEVEPDLVVFATGYLPRFEFLAPELLGVDQSGRPTLYLNAFPRRHPTLSVIGLLQPDSALFPLSHWQSVAVARWLRLRESAPERAAAFASRVDGEAGQRSRQVKLVDTTRHWFEISHTDYLRALQRTLDELEVSP